MRFEKIYANIIIQLMILLPISISASLAAPPVITDFSITSIDNTRVIANFTTDQSSDTRVSFGFDQTFGMLSTCLISQCLIADPTVNHSVLIASLNPDTLYYFKATSQNAGGEEGESGVLQLTTYKTNSIISVNLTGLKDEPIDAVAIEWETSAASNSILYYGNASNNLDRQLSDSAETTYHSITLAGLEPGKTYYYKVKSSYVESSVDSFIAPVDITIPVLAYTRPAEFTTNSTLHIDGTVSENVTLELRVNGYLIVQQKFAAGDFDITTSLSEGKSRIQLIATDDYDNSFIDNFNVTVDSEPPVVSLVNFDVYAPYKTKNITIATDEDARITVRLNNVSVESTTGYVRELNKTLSITADDNVLEIIAQDAAGNTGTITQPITRLKDLAIEILQPNLSKADIAKKLGTNKYQIISGNSLKIIGRTTPGATVKIWRTYEEEIEDYTNITPEYTAVADNLTGVFIIDVDIPDIASRADYDKYKDYYRNLGGGDYEQYTVQFQVNLKATYYLRIDVEDRYGRVNKEGPLSIKVVKDKCGSYYPWIVSGVPSDTHAFKPYRLIDGHELLSFNIKLDWVGVGENPKVLGVVVKQQPITPDMRYGSDNESYECITEGKIFPKTYKSRSYDHDNRTNWFFLYKLEPWNGLNDTMVDSWSDAFLHLANKKCRMDLKVEIKYEYYDPYNQTRLTDKQEFCFRQENIIQDKVDPRMVIPAFLLEGGIKFINTAISVLESTTKVTKLVYDVAKYTCWGLLIDYAYKKIKTRVVCATAKKSGGTNKDTYAEADAQSCADNVQELKTLYNRYRAACDRVWCKTVPADPSEEAEKMLEGDAIKTQTNGPTAQQKCESVNGYVCVERATQYTHYCGLSTPNCYPSSDCQSEDKTGKKELCCCRSTQGDIKSKTQTIVDETKTFGTEQNSYNVWWQGKASTQYLFYGSEQWFVPDGNKKWNFGAWAGYGGEMPDKLVQTSVVYIGISGLKNAEKLKTLVRDQLLINDTLHAGLKVDTYVSGLYGTSCFNQKPWFGSDRIYLTPSQNFFDSIQCACVSDIYGRTLQWLNILTAMRNCLEQIKTTGQADAGACKAMFTQYSCDLLTWVAVKGALIISAGINVAGKTQEVQPDSMEVGTALTTGLKEAVSSFKEDYGTAARLTPQFSMERLTHAVCMFAFTHEWEPGFGGLFTVDTEGPPRQSAAVIAPAERELMGYDPITGKAYFEYKVGVMFTAGSNILHYDVKLLCDAEGDCPGEPKAPMFRSSPELPAGKRPIKSGKIAINQFDSAAGTMYVDKTEFRYNKVQVCWYSEIVKDRELYNGCETVDITAKPDFELIDCGITPGAAVGGNDLFRCNILATQTTATFTRNPPPTHIMVVTQDNQDLDVPFAVQGMYETAEEEAMPLLLSIEETNAEGTIHTPIDPQPIPNGVKTQADFKRPQIKPEQVFTPGMSAITVEKAEETGICAYEIKQGSVTKAVTFTLEITNVAQQNVGDKNPDGTYKNIKIDDLETYGLSKNGLCSGTNCKINPNTHKLELVIGAALVSITPDSKTKCKVNVKTSYTGGATDQVTKYYKFSIHRNDGNNGLGSVVYTGDDQEQSYTVQVTLKRGTITAASAATTKEGVEFNPSTGSFPCPTGASCPISGVSLKGTYSYLQYYIENAAGQTLQDPKTILFGQPVKFVIDSAKVINTADTYLLKIQAAYLSGQAPNQVTRIQNQEYNVVVGGTSGGTTGTGSGGSAAVPTPGG
jgi:hypothetical protein